jgi:nitrogen fixation-related uncharacterized protein
MQVYSPLQLAHNHLQAQTHGETNGAVEFLQLIWAVQVDQVKDMEQAEAEDILQEVLEKTQPICLEQAEDLDLFIQV